MISNGQIKLLHTAKSALGLDDWMYRKLLMRFGGVRSSTDPKFDGIGFRLVMAEMERLGFKRRKREKRTLSGHVVGGASVAQIEYMQDLWARITGHRRGSADFNNTFYTWLYKHFTLLREFEDLLAMLNGRDSRTAHIIIKILQEMSCSGKKK